MGKKINKSCKHFKEKKHYIFSRNYLVSLNGIKDDVVLNAIKKYISSNFTIKKKFINSKSSLIKRLLTSLRFRYGLTPRIYFSFSEKKHMPFADLKFDYPGHSNISTTLFLNDVKKRIHLDRKLYKTFFRKIKNYEKT